MMTENEYKDLLQLRNEIQRAEDNDTKAREIQNLKTYLFQTLTEMEGRIKELQEFRDVLQEVLDGM